MSEPITRSCSDFADIESYDPDGVYYGDKYATMAAIMTITIMASRAQSGDPALPTNGDRNWAIRLAEQLTRRD